MKEINERPICHRAEDLVTYLYNEANEADARDFASHAERCDACRAELAVFQQVHESILLWRTEALGSAFSPTASVFADTAPDSTQLVQHKRKLSALGALREFFNVSPLWLRGATAFAALLLCVLGVLAISRSWNRQAELAIKEKEPRYTQQQFDQAVKKQVDEKLAQLRGQETLPPIEKPTPDKAKDNGTRVATNRVQPKTQRPRGLSRQEREQLASDLRLIPRDDDELPFILSEEP